MSQKKSQWGSSGGDESLECSHSSAAPSAVSLVKRQMLAKLKGGSYCGWHSLKNCPFLCVDSGVPSAGTTLLSLLAVSSQSLRQDLKGQLVVICPAMQRCFPVWWDVGGETGARFSAQPIKPFSDGQDNVYE